MIGPDKMDKTKMAKKYLVTGGAGFIGSWFIRHLLATQKEIHVTNLDLLAYAGNLENLKDVEGDTRYRFVQGDIGDEALVRSSLFTFPSLLTAQYILSRCLVHFPVVPLACSSFPVILVVVSFIHLEDCIMISDTILILLQTFSKQMLHVVCLAVPACINFHLH